MHSHSQPTEGSAMPGAGHPGAPPAAGAAAKRAAGPEVLAGLRLGDAMDGGGACGPLRHDAPLRAAAEALLASGHSALLVADRAGDGPAGLLTENDLVRAYFEGAAPDSEVGRWLEGGLARAPAALLGRLTARASETLAEVAERMVANVLAGDCACHHILVEGEGGGHLGVLSAADLARALCRPGAWANALPHNLRECGDPYAPTAGAGAGAGGLTVGAAMKPREAVFACAAGASIREALRLLLLSQQNGLLVADDAGVRGVVTARGLARAFADGLPSGGPVAALAGAAGARVVSQDDRVVHAAALMAELGREHLVVVRPGTGIVVGMISSLDIVLCTGTRSPLLRPVQVGAGPAVGELLSEPGRAVPSCRADATLGAAAELLLGSGRTAVVVGSEGGPLGLLSEGDLMRALVDGWPRDTSIRRWLLSQESQWVRRPQHLLIRPTVPLTEAAARLLGAGAQGRGPCHHLVVQGEGEEWLGVFSALDVARALSRLESELDVSRTGADQTNVASVMKRVVPRCRPDSLLLQVLHVLLSSGQHCALVLDGAGLRGVVTPRCAVRAFAEGAPRDASVAAVLARQPSTAAAPRVVAPSAPLLEAARAMAGTGLHHLVVAAPGPGGAAAGAGDDEGEGREEGSPASQEGRCGAHGPLGVVSSLDIARGIASLSCQVPFVSLKWLWQCRGQRSCMLRGTGSVGGA